MGITGKQFQSFVMMGCVSGVICSFGDLVLPDIDWLNDVYPGVVLGFFLFFSGKYLANRRSSKPLSELVVIISASIVGWRLAVMVGVESGVHDLFLFAVCGVVGALCVALGLLYTWHIGSGIIPFIIIITLAGALGGFTFHMIELVTGISSVGSDRWWLLLLFLVWQTLLFAGISMALTFGSSKDK